MSTSSRPRQPRRAPRRDPAATRQALLAAGGDLFSERGFDGVSTEDVAEQAGVNKALISYHFGGKQGLYLAAIQHHFSEFADRFTAAEANAATAEDGLRAMLRTFEEMVERRPGFPSAFLRELLSSGLQPTLLPHLVRLVGVSQRLIARGIREGRFRRVDPMVFHFGLVGALVFFFATEPMRRKAATALATPVVAPPPKDFVRYLEGLTLRGLAAERPHRSRKGARS